MIDPILLQNKEVIEKVYEHINIMSAITKQNNNKVLLYSLTILLISYLCFVNKEKIVNSIDIENFKIKKEFKENDLNKIEDEDNEDDLSDFEY